MKRTEVFDIIDQLHQHSLISNDFYKFAKHTIKTGKLNGMTLDTFINIFINLNKPELINDDFILFIKECVKPDKNITKEIDINRLNAQKDKSTNIENTSPKASNGKTYFSLAIFALLLVAFFISLVSVSAASQIEENTPGNGANDLIVIACFKSLFAIVALVFGILKFFAIKNNNQTKSHYYSLACNIMILLSLAVNSFHLLFAGLSDSYSIGNVVLFITVVIFTSIDTYLVFKKSNIASIFDKVIGGLVIGINILMFIAPLYVGNELSFVIINALAETLLLGEYCFNL